jgi:hypothetical protein
MYVAFFLVVLWCDIGVNPASIINRKGNNDAAIFFCVGSGDRSNAEVGASARANMRARYEPAQCANE